MLYTLLIILAVIIAITIAFKLIKHTLKLAGLVIGISFFVLVIVALILVYDVRSLRNVDTYYFLDDDGFTQGFQLQGLDFSSYMTISNLDEAFADNDTVRIVVQNDVFNETPQSAAEFALAMGTLIKDSYFDLVPLIRADNITIQPKPLAFRIITWRS